MVAVDGDYIDDGWGRLVQENQQVKKDLELVMEYATMLEVGKFPKQVPTVLFDYQLAKGGGTIPERQRKADRAWTLHKHHLHTAV